MKILFIGPPGSGKSTQVKLLAEYLNLPYISTGDIFRNLAQEDHEEGKRIKQILDAGQLVDDETVIKLIKKKVAQTDCQNGFILDGYPRNLEQASKLTGVNFDKAFYLKLPKKEVLRRLLKRGRTDDTEESIRKRLDLYYQQTQSLIDYYTSLGILVEIDATRDIQTVQDEIKKFI